MTTLALGLGFLVYGLAEVKSIVWFGLFVSFAMVSALLADLMLLPALIMRVRSSSHFGQEAHAAQRLREQEHAR